MTGMLVPFGTATSGEGGQLRLDVKDLDHLGVVAELWDDLGFTDVLNEAIPADEQVALRPGVVIKALVLNVVSGRDPLYRVQQFFEKRPLDVLLGTGVEAHNLNDAALARHLDRLFEAGGEKVFNALALRAISRERLNVERVHADTTSRLVFGEYRHAEGDDVISITYGYSKDHRPDLKQVMMGIGVNSEGVPVIGQMLDGNQSDKTWNKALVDIVRTRLHVTRDRPLHYVGDSALITDDNLEVARERGIVLTGRLPRTVKACVEAVREAMSHPELWEDLGALSDGKGAACYRAQMQRAKVLGQDVQLGVYATSHSDQRAARSVARQQERALKQAQKDARKLTSKPMHAKRTHAGPSNSSSKRNGGRCSELSVRSSLIVCRLRLRVADQRRARCVKQSNKSNCRLSSRKCRCSTGCGSQRELLRAPAYWDRGDWCTGALAGL